MIRSNYRIGMSINGCLLDNIKINDIYCSIVDKIGKNILDYSGYGYISIDDTSEDILEYIIEVSTKFPEVLFEVEEDFEGVTITWVKNGLQHMKDNPVRFFREEMLREKDMHFERYTPLKWTSMRMFKTSDIKPVKKCPEEKFIALDYEGVLYICDNVDNAEYWSYF